MITHLEMELSEIKSRIFEMADLAVETIESSIDALKRSDLGAARKIIEKDRIFDRLEIEIDNECIKVLVTRQPAAIDLRFVLSVIKMNSDLERIGDLCCNIAKEIIAMDGRPLIKPLIDIPRMSEITVDMIKKSVMAVSDKNSNLAKAVIESDNEVDALNRQVYRELFTYMIEKPKELSQAFGLIMVSKSLERIGDHITNIAERVVYYIDGIDIRHKE